MIWVIVALIGGYALRYFQPVIIAKIKAKFSGAAGDTVV